MNKHSIEGRKPLNNFQHYLKIMRITLSFLFFCILFSSASNSYSQKFTIKSKTASIKEVCKEIEKGSDYVFIFSDNCEKLIDKKVNVEANSKDVTEVLNAVLSSTGLTYKILDKQIVVYKSTESAPSVAVEQPDINIIQQPAKKQITGRIVDAQGEAIIGANIIETGTTNGTVTDIDGKFSLSISNNATIHISYIGYLEQSIATAGQSTFTITLLENTQALDEVVVVGFGTQKKVNLTGSVGTVSSTDLQNRPVQNLTQALQGLVPGLNIQNTSGLLDHTPSVNIRGTGNLGTGSSSSPLVLIDGVESDLKSINPQDVENISVLKDAAASSIYGSRAPFGVILITTKKGISGQTKVAYNNNFRWVAPVILPNIVDSYTFATFMNDAADNAGTGRFVSDERLQRIKDYQNGIITTVSVTDPANPLVWANGNSFGNANVDWYDVYYKNWAFSQEHNMSANGGADLFNYYMSFGYLDQQGLLKVEDDVFQKYTATGTIDAKMTQWLKLRYTTRFTRNDYSRPTDLSQNMYGDLARQSWPFLPVYDDNGYYYSANSPLLPLVEGGRTDAQNDHFNHHASIKIDPITNWETTIEFNYNTKTNSSHGASLPTYWHDVAGNPFARRLESSVSDSGNKTNFTNLNVYSSYQFNLFTGHHFNVMAGGQLESLKYNTYYLSRTGVIVGDLPVIDLTTGLNPNGTPGVPTVGGNSSAWSTAGYFGRLNYNFQSRYLFEANLRYDGSSRFRKDNRWNWFPSFSIGWNIAHENFWVRWRNVVNSLKLRASWGSLGNQNTDSWYPTYQVMPINISAGSWLQNGAKPNIASSPALISTSLTWEKVQSWNVGIDMGAFNNRLTSSFDYYQRRTLDMVGPAMELPSILGKTVPRTNNTDLKTYGFELELAWQDRLSNDFSYGIKFLLSDYQVEITRYPNNSKSLSTYISGQKLYNIWGYETIGIAKSDEEMQEHLITLPNGGQNALGSNWKAGDIMYKDLNGDGKIDTGSNTLDNPGDLKIIGNSTSRYQFGLDFHANWKAFDTRIFFQGVAKRDYWSGTNMLFGGYNNGVYSMIGLKEHMDYFRLNPSNDLPVNLDAYYPRPVMGTTKNQRIQTRYLQSAAYIRLKNISFGYTLPQHLSNKFFVKQLRLFFTGENLWTGTKLASMFDPESIGGVHGTSGDGYPLQKTLSFGLNVTF